MLFVAVLGTATARQDYNYVTVDVPNALGTGVNGINSKGDIVGAFETVDPEGSQIYMCFLRRADGAVVNLQTPNSQNCSAAGLMIVT
jgi:hypothetical protein